VFQLRFTTKREIGLWISVIEDLKSEVARLHNEVEREKARAQAAINLLLAKTQGATIERSYDPSVIEPNSISQITDLFDETEIPMKIGEEVRG
jgi:hypothetical protein